MGNSIQKKQTLRAAKFGFGQAEDLSKLPLSKHRAGHRVYDKG